MRSLYLPIDKFKYVFLFEYGVRQISQQYLPEIPDILNFPVDSKAIRMHSIDRMH